MSIPSEFDTVPIHLSDEHLEAVSRPRRIVLQEDGNTPFEALKMDFGDWLKLRFDHCDHPGSQIDGIWWDIGIAEDTYALYDSKLLPKLQMEGFDEWCRQGIDWVGELVAECHRRGLETFWSSRVCPIDFPQPFRWSEPPVPHHDPSRVSPLKQAHPDWTVPGWWPHGLWNLAVPEVRQRKVEILRELLELYELDGIQLDFARHTPCLPPGKEWEHRDHATAFVRMVRLMMLDLEQRLNRPILLAVRVGETIEGNQLDGLDVARWIEEALVDLVTPGGRTTTIDFAAFRRLVEDRPIKLCASFDGHHTTDGYYFPPMEYYRGVFRNFWLQGADFMALFNWAFAEPTVYEPTGLPPTLQCASHTQATREVGCPEAMAGKDRVYAVERRGGYPWAGNFVYRNDERPLPRGLPAAELPLYVHDDLAHDAAIERIVMRLVLRDAPDDARIEVGLNGQPLAEIRRDPAWTDSQIYGDQPQPNSGAHGVYESNTLGQQLLVLEFAAPAGAFVTGENRVEVSSDTSGLNVEKVEAHVFYG